MLLPQCAGALRCTQDAVAQAIRGAHAVTNQRGAGQPCPAPRFNSGAGAAGRVVLGDQGLLWVWRLPNAAGRLSVFCFLPVTTTSHWAAGMQRGKVKVDGEAEAKRVRRSGVRATVPPEGNGPATAVLAQRGLRDRGMVGEPGSAPSTGLSDTREPAAHQRGRESQRGHTWSAGDCKRRQGPRGRWGGGWRRLMRETAGVVARCRDSSVSVESWGRVAGGECAVLARLGLHVGALVPMLSAFIRLTRA